MTTRYAPIGEYEQKTDGSFGTAWYYRCTGWAVRHMDRVTDRPDLSTEEINLETLNGATAASADHSTLPTSEPDAAIYGSETTRNADAAGSAPTLPLE